MLYNAGTHNIMIYNKYVNVDGAQFKEINNWIGILQE